MRWSRTLQVVRAHAEGEVGLVVTGGLLGLPGGTMAEKLVTLRSDDSLLRLLLLEPRGAAQVSANLLLPPTRADADAGFVVLQPDGPHAMSGSNAMCVTTVLLETGMIAMQEPETLVRLDTPAGPVVARATCRDGRCERVALDFPASFAAHLNHPLEVEGLGRITVDVGYGGAFYVLVDADRLGLAVRPDCARRLVEVGERVRSAAEDQIEVVHTEIPALDRIEYVMVSAREGDDLRNATVIHPGRIDRSPCGTGTAARLAVMHARGEVEAGRTLTFRSIIDSRFEATIRATDRVGERPAIRPRIEGRAWITAIGQLGVDPTDPYARGFTLDDTWGPAAGRA